MAGDSNPSVEVGAAAETEQVTPPPSVGPDQASGEPTAELESALAEVASLQERLLRKAAEFENYRRRTDAERRASVQFGQAQVVEQFLDVFDDLRRSVEAAQQADEEATTDAAWEVLKKGVEMVYAKFDTELKKLGVEPIEAVGKPFDEAKHEALMKQPAPAGTEPGTVLAEIQRGYRMHDRILRHPRVIVAE